MFTRVDEHGVPLERETDDLSVVVRTAINKARILKDQLAGIEESLHTELGADGDSELSDAILQAIHADGTPESILQLIES
jgi:hypothetical protein